MLNRLLKVRKLKPLSFIVPSLKPSSMALPEETMPALKIVHAGGFVESYYTAVSAAKVMEKYPSFLLTKPEVFRRPWDSVVRPDEILTPGEKYFVVPCRTVKKLRRRIQKPNKEESKTSKDFSKRNEVEPSETRGPSNNASWTVSRMRNASKKRVRFAGIGVKHKIDRMDVSRKSSNPDQSHGGRRRVRNHVTWHPTLTSITESRDTNF
ncbi:hypothetical protein FNV43_RR14984 [Rhamnella rubrinervis]|uniref:Uncharacterized protein n=1 Tax=Rhamnella rubrinervis TaxID=2594499 RepID=A0A8K0H472_9ROSA|nr:hypothetical protein FNV43_RR14984 [Rhamnella rubrinervis]